MAVPERDKKMKRLYAVAGAVNVAPGYYLSIDYHIDFETVGRGVKTQLKTDGSEDSGDDEYHKNDMSLYDETDQTIEKRWSIGARGKYCHLKFHHTGTEQPVTVYGYTWGYRPKKLR